MNASISILAEIPEELHESLRSYLDTHPDWDQDRVFSAALSLFLLQNSTSDSPETSRNYRQAQPGFIWKRCFSTPPINNHPKHRAGGVS